MEYLLVAHGTVALLLRQELLHSFVLFPPTATRPPHDPELRYLTVWLDWYTLSSWQETSTQTTR